MSLSSISSPLLRSSTSSFFPSPFIPQLGGESVNVYRHPYHVEPQFLSNKKGIFYEYEEPEAIEKYYPENYYKLSEDKTKNSSNEKVIDSEDDPNHRRVGTQGSLSFGGSTSSSSNNAAFITPSRVSLVVTLLLIPLGLGLFYYGFILNGPTPVVKARLNDFIEELTKLFNGLLFSRSSRSAGSRRNFELFSTS